MDFTIATRATPYRILAMVQYTKVKPYSVAMPVQGLVGEEKLYDKRARMKQPPTVGSIVEAEVVDLQFERLKFETESQNTRLFYYLPKAFEKKEVGGTFVGNS